jgi:tripartite-type tricarboxylate transporter receptor subunit TctC
MSTHPWQIRAIVSCTVSFLGAIGSPAAQAAERYPARPVRFVVPYAPGGGSEITARAIGQKLYESLGQSFIIDTRPGAGSMIGTEIVARSTPDGYTLILADMPHSINTVVYAKPRYHALNDFAPITVVGTAPIMVVAHPTLPYNSLKEMLALPKATTEKIPVGSPGLGSAPHMTYELLRARSGFSLNHVPYKGGGPLMIDVVAGQIPMGVSATPSTLPHVRAGRLKGIAITSLARHPLAPNVPTVAESGVPGFDVIHWYGVLAPARTPKAIVDLLNGEIHKALNAPEVRERFTQLAIDLAPGSPEDFRKRIEGDLVRWGEAAKTSGLRLD